MDPAAKRRFPWYGWMGVAIMAGAELALFRRWTSPGWIDARGEAAAWAHLSAWTTPFAWWGYVFAMDGLLVKLTGTSPLKSRPRVFLSWLPMSVFFWVVFEIYNLHLRNWTYVGVPEDLFTKAAIGVISFATIQPGMFLTAEVIAALGPFRNYRIRPIKVTGSASLTLAILGLCFLILPLMLPQSLAVYTFAVVWIGFFFFFEPVNHASGTGSILHDLEEGRIERFLNLMAAGYVCGFCWEFWNYTAECKWVYTAPFTENVRIFEMPLVGFLGFGPFALEYFAFYHFVRIVWRTGDSETVKFAFPAIHRIGASEQGGVAA